MPVAYPVDLAAHRTRRRTAGVAVPATSAGDRRPAHPARRAIDDDHGCSTLAVGPRALLPHRDGAVGSAYRDRIGEELQRQVPPIIATIRTHPRAYGVASASLAWGLLFTGYAVTNNNDTNGAPEVYAMPNPASSPASAGSRARCPWRPGGIGYADRRAAPAAPRRQPGPAEQVVHSRPAEPEPVGKRVHRQGPLADDLRNAGLLSRERRRADRRPLQGRRRPDRHHEQVDHACARTRRRHTGRRSTSAPTTSTSTGNGSTPTAGFTAARSQ